jgi:hypothetical protein
MNPPTPPAKPAGPAPTETARGAHLPGLVKIVKKPKPAPKRKK